MSWVQATWYARGPAHASPWAQAWLASWSCLPGQHCLSVHDHGTGYTQLTVLRITDHGPALRHQERLAGPAPPPIHWPTKREAHWALENREVMAGLGLGTEGHLAAVSSYNAAQKAFGLLAKALPSPSASLPPGIILFAVPSKAYLAHDTLKQCLDVVMQCC